MVILYNVLVLVLQGKCIVAAVKNVSSAVSQAPTAVPTPAPTAAPTLRPTASPTAIDPTTAPTAVPTAKPTAQSSPIVTFQSTLTLQGVAGTSLDSNSQSALINVTASSMGVPIAAVTYVVPTSEQRLQQRLSYKPNANGDLTAVTEVNIPLDTTSYTNATLLYTTLVSSLAASVGSGSFSQQLHQVSLSMGADQLFEANVTSVQSSPMVVEDYHSSDDDDNYNVITAAIVGGAVVAGIALYVAIGRHILLRDEGKSDTVALAGAAV
jgi:hypothetical protein